MLKIKDNIDLKELEKFGFEFEAKGWFFYTNDNIVVNIDFEHTIWFKPDYEDWFNIPNIIFDLIKANMVEKVVEE